MINELERLVERICDEGLRGMVREFLEVAEVGLEGEKLPLDVCPGGAYIHHAYEGGLLQHIVAVTRLCMTLCDLIEEIYGGSVIQSSALRTAMERSHAPTSPWGSAVVVRAATSASCTTSAAAPDPGP